MEQQRNSIHLKVRIKSDPGFIFGLLASDAGRGKFWAEKTIEENGQIQFFFPNTESYASRILEKIPDRSFKIEYFNSIVLFNLTKGKDGYCILEMINSDIPEKEFCENYAGWVSVLMNLKAYAEYRADLRNHNPAFSWDHGFVDN